VCDQERTLEGNHAGSPWCCCDICNDCVPVPCTGQAGKWSCGCFHRCDVNDVACNVIPQSCELAAFCVLKKMKFRHVANSGATTALNNTNVPFEMYKKCNIPIEYSGTTGAITEIREQQHLPAGLLGWPGRRPGDHGRKLPCPFLGRFVTPRMFRNPPGGEEQSAPTVGPKNEIF